MPLELVALTPVGGEVLSRFGPKALWTATFLVAMLAVSVYVAIHRVVTLRSHAVDISSSVET